MRRMICAAVLCCFLTLPSFAADTPKYLALTFDDGPSGRFTSRLLDGLAAREVHATFFLCGYRIEQYPELTARIAREGHEIGTHGYAHKYFNSLSAEGVCRDLSKTQRCIEEAGGGQPTLLRPPGGLYDTKYSPKSGSGMSDSGSERSGTNMGSHPSSVVRQYEGHEAAAGV